MKLKCPHGSVDKHNFQWQHAGGEPCSVMLERAYDRVATEWQPSKKKFDMGDPETVAFIATKDGTLEYAAYLCGVDNFKASADEMVKRMTTLMLHKAVYSVVANTLYAIPGFSENVWWLSHRIPGYQAPDVWYGKWCAPRTFKEKGLEMLKFADWERNIQIGDVSGLIDQRITEARRAVTEGVSRG